jgi:hypothetical protein
LFYFTAQNETCFDTFLKKDLQAAHAIIFLLTLLLLLLLLLGTQSNQLSMAEIGYFIPKSAILHNQIFFDKIGAGAVTNSIL